MTTIPTISQLYTDVLSDLEAEMTITIPVFGKFFLRAFAAVQAAKLWLIYLAVGFVQKNIFIDTADPVSMGGSLERFGYVKLGRLPFPATAGQYEVTITGSTGAIVPAKATFKSDDTSASPGKLFVLDVAYTLTAPTDTITIRALEAGLDSKLEIGNTLTATAPIANVNKTAAVTAETVEPLSAEDIEEYRQKAIQAYRLEPQGGAATDYRRWSSDAQGVQNVYPYAAPGNDSEVNLYVEATIADSTDGKGTPSAGLLADVEEVVDLDPDTTKPILDRGRRPLQVIVNYLPVTIVDVDIDIADFQDLTAAKQTAILNALTAAISEIRPFIAGADILSEKNDILNTNKIVFEIQTAVPGSVFGAVTMTIDGSPEATYTFLNGEIPYLNSVSYV